MWILLTIREVIAMIVFTGITFLVGYTIGETHGKGGTLKDWLNSFFE